MKFDWKEILFYPAMTAVVCSGVNAFGDWRRGTLASFWWYVIATLILFAVIALGRFLIFRKKGKKNA